MANSHAPVDFWDAFWGCMVIANGVLIIVCWITCVAVGWNRMSSIPFIISATGFVANYLAWVSYEDLPKARLYTVRFIAQTGWHIQEVIPVFYSYFLLQRLLKNSTYSGIWSRRTFTYLFWLFTTINILDRIAILGMYVHSWGMNDKTTRYADFFKALEHVNIVYFVFTAATEILTATYLLKLFHTSIRTAELYCGGQRVGLFKQMALSTEIRVSSLAIIGITRAGCARARSLNTVAYGFDTVMWTVEDFYPMILVIDLFMAKLGGVYIKVDKANRTVINGGQCQCGRQKEGQKFVSPGRSPHDTADIDDTLGSVIQPKDSKGSAGDVGYIAEHLSEVKSIGSVGAPHHKDVIMTV